jgi:hypothetical protein
MEEKGRMMSWKINGEVRKIRVWSGNREEERIGRDWSEIMVLIEGKRNGI